MREIAEQDFTGNLFKLLAETFEGPPEQGASAYLDKGAGLFQTLAKVTAAAASHQPYPGSTTIVAHVAHLDYYVRVLHNFIVGQDQTIDWESSWQTQMMSADEWDALKQRLQTGY